MLKTGIFFLLLSVWLLAGCSLHQARPITPSAPLPDQYSDQTGQDATPDFQKPWWHSFNDPGLERLIQQLFRSNLSLVQGHARLQQSAALMRQIRSFRYPNLTLDGQTGRSGQPGLFGELQSETSQLSVSASFELDLFNKLSAKDQAARLSYRATRNDLQSLYMNLSAQLADLYYLAIEQRAQIQLTDQTIQRYQDSLQRVENRYRQGITTVTDLYQARQSLATAKASRMTFQQALRVTENAIAVMLGNYPGMNPLPQQKQIPLAPPQLPAGVPATLLQYRPDLRAGLFRVKSRDAETAAAIADRFPSFNLVGSFGRSRSDITGTLLSGNFWNLLLKLSQPLFDGGRRKAEVARNRAALAESVAAYQESVLRAFQEVEDALSGNRTTSIRIEHLMEQERATRATQRLALDRYLRGLSDYLPVLTAQVFHFNTQSQLLTARRQLLSQRISLARALGGTWMANQSATDHQRLARQEMGK